MTTLTSRNNPKIKQIRQLLGQRKERDATGLFVVEGIRHVGEAIAAQTSVDYICYAPDLLTSDFATQLIQEQTQRGISCFAVDRETFTGLSGKEIEMLYIEHNNFKIILTPILYEPALDSVPNDQSIHPCYCHPHTCNKPKNSATEVIVPLFQVFNKEIQGCIENHF